jgi:phosphoesterase RecJ-like protein
MIDRVGELIEKADRILVTSHVNPDGDAVGCLLGCGRLLELLGKEFVLYAPDSIPELFQFLHLSERVTSVLHDTDRFPLTLVFDTADPSLLGENFPTGGRQGQTVVIDHHLRHKSFGDVIWRDPTASAAAVLLYRLAVGLEVSDDPALAEALWCGIYTDTGGFRYSSTTPEALRISADLLEWGVNPWKMATEMFESNPAGRVRLLSRVLATLELTADGKVASLTVPESLLTQEGLDASMLDTFINYARGIRGVEVALQISERNGGWKVSLRSKGQVDVSALAEKFGGGGHRNAAGFFLTGDLASVQRRVLEAAEQLVGSGH